MQQESRYTPTRHSRMTIFFSFAMEYKCSSYAWYTRSVWGPHKIGWKPKEYCKSSEQHFEWGRTEAILFFQRELSCTGRTPL